METLNKIDVLIDGIGSALIPATLFVVPLIGGQNLGAAMGLVQTPGLTVTDVFIQLQRLVLGQNANSIDAGVYTVRKWKVNDTILSAEGYSRLGGFFCQNLQTAALTACQKHGDTAFFLKIHADNSFIFVEKTYFVYAIIIHP